MPSPFLFRDIYQNLNVKLLGDSRARHFAEVGEQKGPQITHCSYNGQKTGSAQYLAASLTGEEDIVIVFLLQCDFTKKVGSMIQPTDTSVESMLRDVTAMHEAISDKCPSAYIIWTIPIVKKFSVPQEAADRTAAVQMQWEMATKQRSLIQKMKCDGFHIYDLTRTFITGEDRTPYGSTRTIDCVHPTPAGIKHFYLQLYKQLVQLGVLRKVEAKKKEIIACISYENV